MEKAVGEEDEIAEERAAAAPTSTVPVPRKRKRAAAAVDGGGAPAARICDDVVSNILARLPARTAVACTALSKHHRRLIRSPEFGSLHRGLAPPLPRPHVAYVATAPIRRRPEQEDPVSLYHGFHVAGAGLGGGGGGGAPMRALTGWRLLGTKCVGTCNGVVLLASEEFSQPCRCILWNPAIADVSREVTIPKPSPLSECFLGYGRPVSECLVLGLGYGRRSKTYKLLLCRKDSHPIKRWRKNERGIRCRISGGPDHRIEYSLVIHSLGDDDAEKQAPLRTVLSEGVDENIKDAQKSLYVDGTVYLLCLENSEIIAFDVDEETVSKIDIPGEQHQEGQRRRLRGTLELIEMSGRRPCMVTIVDNCIALWLLTADRLWEQTYVTCRKQSIYCRSIIGVWDCGGVLLLHVELHSTRDQIWLYDVTTKKMFKADIPGELMIELCDYEICWGYNPTLVSPGSIVGEINQDLERRRNRSARIAEVTNPLGMQDSRKGQEATLNTTCLMEFLVRIMQKLPDEIQYVVEMSTMDSEDPDFLFENAESSDSESAESSD